MQQKGSFRGSELRSFRPDNYAYSLLEDMAI